MSYPKHYVDEIKAERDALKAKLQAAEAEVARLKGERQARVDLQSVMAYDLAQRTATEAALRWAANDIQTHDHPVAIWDAWIREGLAALLGEK